MKREPRQVRLLKTLSHPVRLEVLEILRDGEQCVCHMEAMLGRRQAAISQQLMVLRREGLVRVRREGLNIFYRVSRPQVFDVVDALNAASGGQPPAIRHRHGPTDCPCPKCAIHTDKPRPSRREQKAVHGIR